MRNPEVVVEIATGLVWQVDAVTSSGQSITCSRVADGESITHVFSTGQVRTLEIRPEIRRFASKMESRMLLFDPVYGRQGWRVMKSVKVAEQLLRLILIDSTSLVFAVAKKDRESVSRLTLDISNRCLMIEDLLGDKV